MTLLRLLAAGLLMTAPLAAQAQPAGSMTSSQSGSSPATQAVAVSRLSVPDADHPALEVGVWALAPMNDTPRPLIVISHGNGGDYRSHHDTAQALARAGFVVASLTHTGDNWRDQSRATDLGGRVRQLTALVDYLTLEWTGRGTIDSKRVGAFGFSAGGFTVLTAAGGVADLERLRPHCRANPTFFDCLLIQQHAETVAGHRTAPTAGPGHRLKALVVAAPALGFTFTDVGLATVTQPVQLWQASDDEILPAPFYVEPVREALPDAPEYHLVPDAGHFDFLPPCNAQLTAAAPMICTPTPGFDRAAFRDRFNAEIVRFFLTRL